MASPSSASVAFVIFCAMRSKSPEKPNWTRQSRYMLLAFPTSTLLSDFRVLEIMS